MVGEIEMNARGPESPSLTHSQTQIWIGQRLHPESPLYNMAFAFVFPMEIRTDLFFEAWRRVVDGSDALRSRVEELDGEGMVLIDAECTSSTEVLETQGWTDPEAGFLAWCRERGSRPLPVAETLIDEIHKGRHIPVVLNPNLGAPCVWRRCV